MKTNNAHKIRRVIEGCELPHVQFVAHYEALARRIDGALDGYLPSSEWVIGPSRVGKSMLINNLARNYPETKIDGVRRIPVLVVELPTPISPKEMPRSVLDALGMPSGRGNSGDLFGKMERLLRTAGTKVILFDEASHIVEVGTKMPSRAAGDWFKQVIDRLGMTIVLFGVPRLEKLYQSNEQLRKRSQARIEFRPYDHHDTAQYRAFRQCVRTYLDMFEADGWTLDLPFDQFADHCYLLSGGLIGVLSAFMNRLACDIDTKVPRPLTVTDLAATLKKSGAAGDPNYPAFTRADVTPGEREQALSFVLTEANLPRRR